MTFSLRNVRGRNAISSDSVKMESYRNGCHEIVGIYVCMDTRHKYR